MITEPNLTISMSWPNGLLTQLTETDTTTQSVPYSTQGQTRTWNYTYYPSGTNQGLLKTVEGPLGTTETTTYTYNSNGFIQTVADPEKLVTTVSAWNVWGEPLTSVGQNGTTTTYTYDLRARLKTVTVNPGTSQSETQFGYDNAGNLTSIVFPDNSSLTYKYDAAHRLQSVTNNLGESITYTLDAMGDRTQTTTSNASATVTRMQSATFDELARLLTEIGAYNQTTQYGYDRDNNVVSTLDPRSKLYSHAFDAIERVMQETDPDQFQTTIGYDGNDNVTSVADARTLLTSYVRDGFGDVIQITSPDTGTAVLWYDGNGKVTKKIDSRGVETDYTNDALGRVTMRKINAQQTETVTYHWGNTKNTTSAGRLASLSDPSGSTTFSYDALGNMTEDKRVVSGKTYATLYNQYDPAGHLLQMTYPSGLVVTYTRDGLGRISGVTAQPSGQAQTTVVSSSTYMPFGPLAGLSYGNGVTLTQGWDQDYHLTSITAASGSNVIQNLTYQDDADGNIQTITDNLNAARNQSFTYDDLNRLWSASGLYGAESWLYDGVGNRTSATVNGTTSTYTPATTSNQIASITTGGNTRSFAYYPSGQVSSDQRAPTTGYAFTYNGSARMASVSLNGKALATYLYNGLEQRVLKTVSGTKTAFVFDRFGHLLAEANNATGAMLREYIWMDDKPVAMVDDTGATPVVYDILTDHLNRPQKLTDQNANLVWDGVFDPFGNVTSISGSATMLLMFPGQYYDSETQLSQNWNRDYDPTIGRYIQSDPIGLSAGINTYAYTLDEPTILTDPNGKGALGSLLGGAPGSLLEDLLNSIDRLARDTTGGVCPEDPDRCKKAADLCHEECEPLLGKGGRTNQGVPYRNCWVRCMKRYGCYKGDSPVE